MIVSLFAVIAEVLRPTSFAGLFGAAPWIALSTLGLTIVKHGSGYASTEARSMVLGAVAFFCYAAAASWLLLRYRKPALTTTAGSAPGVVRGSLCAVLPRVSITYGRQIMMVQAKLAAIKGIKLHEYAVLFIFGGLVCVIAGLISKRFGAEVGGLFLAFPAIFPAGACLVEAHEKKHKARQGIDGTNRARAVAGVDAAGAALGSIGLAGFAMACWLLLRD